MQRSYYSSSISDFIEDNDSRIIGELATRHSFDLESLQKNAWRQQIVILKDQLAKIGGHIYFEFAIPRMGKRVDNIVISGNSIFVVEFKVGEKTYPSHAIDQVLDYALDLKNFHEGSHDKDIIPILVSSNANPVDLHVERFHDSLYSPIRCNAGNLGIAIEWYIDHTDKLDPDAWSRSRYKPTPTIVEAAQALYKGHNVQEISRSDSGAINLSKTTNCISKIIERSKAKRRKSICFLTGVPGAGKTLAGLNIANTRMRADESEHAVFLSGNGPLVQVLREALARDQAQSSSVSKKEAKQKASAFIQNIHHFRDDALLDDQPPIEKVVVFDEAQRAWTKEKSSSFMQQRGNPDFEMSEPDFLISILDRHDDWCTIVCLIGGGQEINTGEAGLEEWVLVLRNHYSSWDIFHSELITTNDDYLRRDDLRDWLSSNSSSVSDLHLAVSVRSFRSEKVSDLVRAILNTDTVTASEILRQLNKAFPIKLCRSLNVAKEWVQNVARGNERIGLICSSGGKRLRPHGIYAGNQLDPANWFLNPKEDVRSSNYLEDVATEFDIQGLEIDWALLAWDNDLYFNSGWNFQKFRGTNSEDDPTRSPLHYDGTFNYLVSIGLEVLD
jgi:hypothetical protein